MQDWKWDFGGFATEQSCNIYSAYFSSQDAVAPNEIFGMERYMSDCQNAWKIAKEDNGPNKKHHSTYIYTQWYCWMWYGICIGLGWDVFRKFQRPYSIGTAKHVNGSVDEKSTRMAKELSDITGLDMSKIIRMFSLHVSDDVIKYCSKYPDWEIPRVIYDPTIKLRPILDIREK